MPRHRANRAIGLAALSVVEAARPRLLRHTLVVIALNELLGKVRQMEAGLACHRSSTVVNATELLPSYALRGNDCRAGGGNDRMDGGPGDDILDGGTGTDLCLLWGRGPMCGDKAR